MSPARQAGRIDGAVCVGSFGRAFFSLEQAPALRPSDRIDPSRDRRFPWDDVDHRDDLLTYLPGMAMYIRRATGTSG